MSVPNPTVSNRLLGQPVLHRQQIFFFWMVHQHACFHLYWGQPPLSEMSFVSSVLWFEILLEQEVRVLLLLLVVHHKVRAMMVYHLARNCHLAVTLSHLVVEDRFYHVMRDHPPLAVVWVLESLVHEDFSGDVPVSLVLVFLARHEIDMILPDRCVVNLDVEAPTCSLHTATGNEAEIPTCSLWDGECVFGGVGGSCDDNLGMANANVCFGFFLLVEDTRDVYFERHMYAA